LYGFQRRMGFGKIRLEAQGVLVLGAGRRKLPGGFQRGG